MTQSLRARQVPGAGRMGLRIRMISAGLTLSSAACGESKPVGVQNVTVGPDAGAEAGSSPPSSAAVARACGDPLAAPLPASDALALAFDAWFAAPAGATCADTPAASVTQAWVSAAQEIYLTGSFVGAADFGNGALPYQNSDQVFVAVFKPDGQPKWSHAQRGTTASMSVDAQGNVAVLSAWIGALNEVGGAGMVNSYGPDGGLRWTREIPFGLTSEHRGLASVVSDQGVLSLAVPGRLVTLDSSGAIIQEQDYGYVAPIGLGMGAAANRLLGGISSVSYDPLRVSAFVAGLDPLGQESWRLPIASPDADGALQNLHAGAGTGMAISGTFYDQVTIGATTLRGGFVAKAPAPSDSAAGPAANAVPDKEGAFLALIDDQGAVVWARETLAARLGTPQSIAFDDAGKMIVAAAGAEGTVTISALDCRGDQSWAQTFSGLVDAQVIAQPVPGTTDIVLSGSTGAHYQPACATCCYAPRPYLARVARDGRASPGFRAHR